MTRQRIYDELLYAHFVTFSCYRRRRLLDHDRSKKIVLGVLDSQLAKQPARCVGIVVMPDHVHAVMWFPEPHRLAVEFSPLVRATKDGEGADGLG